MSLALRLSRRLEADADATHAGMDIAGLAHSFFVVPRTNSTTLGAQGQTWSCSSGSSGNMLLSRRALRSACSKYAYISPADQWYNPTLRRSPSRTHSSFIRPRSSAFRSHSRGGNVVHAAQFSRSVLLSSLRMKTGVGEPQPASSRSSHPILLLHSILPSSSLFGLVTIYITPESWPSPRRSSSRSSLHLPS
jgi:hypothetical protein